ncbi:hypothetical protein SAMN05428949_4295 [Chitinophaga sp. YR627]|nr:hypothetical protein SAMN05428949_4295 [Chitinophaga sp. YR627]
MKKLSRRQETIITLRYTSAIRKKTAKKTYTIVYQHNKHTPRTILRIISLLHRHYAAKASFMNEQITA